MISPKLSFYNTVSLAEESDFVLPGTQSGCIPTILCSLSWASTTICMTLI